MAKIGAGALAAAGRQGLKELGAALKPLPDSIQIDELGTLGTATPQLITEDMKQVEVDTKTDRVRQPEIDME